MCSAKPGGFIKLAQNIIYRNPPLIVVRIVSLAPSNTEILYALGAQDQIAGVTRYCDYPAEARVKPIVSGWSDVDVKKIAALKPDLVLTSSIVQANAAKTLRQEGLPVIHLDPTSLEDVFETFLKIGHAVNAGTKARELIINTDKKLAAIVQQNTVKGKRIYVEEWHKPPTAAANWVPDLLKLLGCEAVTRSGIPSHEITAEQITQFNPDAIVLSWCGFGTSATANQLLERDGWQELNAIKNNNVFIIDDSFLNRPGPRLVEGLRVLAEIAKRC
jgi:iron complex transport system substrate-binding protein